MFKTIIKNQEATAIVIISTHYQIDERYTRPDGIEFVCLHKEINLEELGLPIALLREGLILSLMITRKEYPKMRDIEIGYDLEIKTLRFVETTRKLLVECKEADHSVINLDSAQKYGWKIGEEEADLMCSEKKGSCKCTSI